MVVANSKNGGKKLTCAVKKRSGVNYCNNPDVELDDFLKSVGTSLKERLSAPSIIEEQLNTLASNTGEHIAQEKSRQEAIAKRLKEIEHEKANLMAALKTAAESFPENVQDFNQALGSLNKEKEQLSRQQKNLEEETQELIAFLADPDGLRETIQELGDQIDPEDLELTSRFLKSFINRVDVSCEEATMYYSMPLAKTVETKNGHRASATIERGDPEILLEQCAPAGAGIDPGPVGDNAPPLGFPRLRGDRPWWQYMRAVVGGVPPQARG